MHRCFIVGCALWQLLSLKTNAGDFSLADFSVNQDGVISSTLPNGSAFDTSSGLGTIKIEFFSPGFHSGFLFVDHEISEQGNNTFFNELGEAIGSAPSGLSWEIDEPGFSSDPGDIFDNFTKGTLDNHVGKTLPNDVSMALGWAFTLEPGETGTIDFFLKTTEPPPFYLRQLDPDSGLEIFFSSSLTIDQHVPDCGSSLALLGGSVFALFLIRKFFIQGDPFWHAKSGGSKT